MLKLRKARRNLGRKARLAGRYLKSVTGARYCRDDLKQVQAFCLFIGYPRSGHSLVGSLMDAPPQAVIAHELNALKLVRYGFAGPQTMHEILHNSAALTDAGRAYTGYSYAVPDQWQGRYRDLRLVGDKFGDFSIEAISRKPRLVDKLRHRLGVPVKFVHVVRNPFDNITTIQCKKRGNNRTLDQGIDYYFALLDGVARLKQQVPVGDVYDLHLERLVNRPTERLLELARFYGLDADPAWAEACADIVFEKPRRTRDQIDWPDAAKKRVEARIAMCDYLDSYAFD